MSEIPDELGALLSRARQDGPGAERLAEVRARLESQLGPLDAPRPPAAPALAPKVTLGVVAVLALLALGAWLAGRSAPDDARAEQAHSEATIADGRETIGATAAQAAASAEALAGMSAEALAAAEAEPEDGAETEPADGAETARAGGRADRATPTATDRVAPRRAEARPVPAPIEAPTSDSASTLREEIALLDRALRAREAGDLARARATLDEHRARFPSGALSPERDRMLAELEHARATRESTTTP